MGNTLSFLHFNRSTLPEPVLENGKIIEEREKVKAEVIYNFRQKREIVFQQREKERQSRRQLKAQQLQMFEDLQVKPFISHTFFTEPFCKLKFRAFLQHMLQKSKSSLPVQHQGSDADGERCVLSGCEIKPGL